MHLFTFIFSFLICVQSNFTFEKSIKTDATDFNLDELGNIYLIKATSIERHNAVGNMIFRTSELNYGNIDYFDVTNPLKPFIHYRALGKLILFDNTLSQQGNDIDLFDKGFEQVELVSGSRGDAYWLWDSRNSEMIRVDQNFQRLTSTGNLSVLLGKTIRPMQILERGNHVYLRDEGSGVLVFDIYGTYKTTLNIHPIRDMQVVKDEIVYTTLSGMMVLSSDWMTEEEIELPVDEPARAMYFNKRLYCLNGGALQVWKMEENTRN